MGLTDIVCKELLYTVYCIYFILFFCLSICSAWPAADQNGERHPGWCKPPLCSQAPLCLPDRGQALPHPRLPQGRRSLHKALQGGANSGGEGLMEITLKERWKFIAGDIDKVYGNLMEDMEYDMKATIGVGEKEMVDNRMIGNISRYDTYSWFLAELESLLLQVHGKLLKFHSSFLFRLLSSLCGYLFFIRVFTWNNVIGFFSEVLVYI